MPPTPRLLACAAILALTACASGPISEPPPADLAAMSASATATYVVAEAPAADPATQSAAEAARLVGTAPAAPDALAGVDSAASETSEARPAPTQAELDFAALYGGEVYDPVADPTLPSPAELPTSYDPWESFNRRMHVVNTVIDERVARPLANAYMEVVPRPIRLGIGNFFRNLGQPVSAINAMLQGKPMQAGQGIARFLLNTTVGVAGIFDPATELGLPLRNEDFGQTLGVWGWERSRYVELPLFGPRTVRDVFGLFGDAPLSPLRQVGEDPVRVGLQGLQLVDVRTQLMSLDSLRAGATDDYALTRDAWYQRRTYQIFGDRLQPGEESLPDYLLDDTVPQVPAGAMPVLPSGTN